MNGTRRGGDGAAGFGLFTLAMAALFVGLGLWQLHRRVEKHSLIAALTKRIAAEPKSLPDPSAWVNHPRRWMSSGA
jgi:cytochrome oxidase assembly protein ShyY1